jgi:hypothetical protein
MENYVKKETNQNGSICYYNSKGQRHRLDGPAIEYMDGSYEWFKNGYCHRLDGPALKFPGQKQWWVNGKRHRVEGPAIERMDGYKEWRINGEIFFKAAHNRLYLFSILESIRIDLSPTEEY